MYKSYACSANHCKFVCASVLLWLISCLRCVQPSCHLFYKDFYVFMEEGVTWVTHLVLSTLQSLILYMLTSCFYTNHIYYKKETERKRHGERNKKLLWWRLRDALICECKDKNLGSVYYFAHLIGWFSSKAYLRDSQWFLAHLTIPGIGSILWSGL